MIETLSQLATETVKQNSKLGIHDIHVDWAGRTIDQDYWCAYYQPHLAGMKNLLRKNSLDPSFTVNKRNPEEIEQEKPRRNSNAGTRKHIK